MEVREFQEEAALGVEIIAARAIELQPIPILLVEQRAISGTGNLAPELSRTVGGLEATLSISCRTGSKRPGGRKSGVHVLH